MLPTVGFEMDELWIGPLASDAAEIDERPPAGAHFDLSSVPLNADDGAIVSPSFGFDGAGPDASASATTGGELVMAFSDWAGDERFRDASDDGAGAARDGGCEMN